VKIKEGLSALVGDVSKIALKYSYIKNTTIQVMIRVFRGASSFRAETLYFSPKYRIKVLGNLSKLTDAMIPLVMSRQPPLTSILSRNSAVVPGRIHHPYSRSIGPNVNAKEEYEKNGSWGMLTSIDAYGCRPELIRSKENLRKYIIELCRLIDMKMYGETIIEYFGENEKVEGFSVVQLIETSCISMHCANSTNVVYTDIFSCKSYDPVVATKFTAEFFGAKEWDYNVLLRGVSHNHKKAE
jgi:S-adenosylmethionine/arginine decarboxylase-like enzyme